MSFEELLIAIVVSLAIGFTLGFFYMKAQITAIEEKYRADLEKWKVEAAGEIRKDFSEPFTFHAQWKNCGADGTGAPRICVQSCRRPVHRLSRGLHHL